MTPRPSAASQDSSHKRSAFSATSHTNDSSYSSTTSGGLDLSASSHSIAKHTAMKKGPIIRVVHVFAPQLIKTDVENFRTLVQKLTGNHTSNEAEEGQQEEATQTHELRHQKEKEATMLAYSPAVSSSSEVLHTQVEGHYDHSIVSSGFLQAELGSAYPGLTIYKEQSMASPPRLERIIEEKEVNDPVDQFNQELDYFRVANYSNDNRRYYDHDSPSSLDDHSTSTSTTREGSLKHERENDCTAFLHELDSMQGGFHLSDPFMSLDDQQYFLMGAADTKLDFISLDPTW